MEGHGEEFVEANSPDKATPEPAIDPEPDHAWKALSLVNDWIKHAEGKAGITLARRFRRGPA